MKQLIKKSVLSFIVISACIFIPTTLEAQSNVNCAFYIFNHRNCPVTVHFEVSDCLGGVCGGSGIFCSNTALVIPANTPIFLPCCIPNPVPYTPTVACPWLGGDVWVWLKKINGINVNGTNNSQAVSRGNCFGSPSTGGGPVPATIVFPCNAPGVYMLVASPNGVDIY